MMRYSINFPISYRSISLGESSCSPWFGICVIFSMFPPVCRVVKDLDADMRLIYKALDQQTN